MPRRTARRAPGAWGTAEQLPSGRWRAFYRREGAKFTAPHTFPTKDDALSWLASERTDRGRGTWQDPRTGSVTLAEYAATWMDARPDLSPRTRDTYTRSLERWVLPQVGEARGAISLGEFPVNAITPAAVRSWYAAVYTAAKTSASRRQAKELERREHPARVWARARGMVIAESGRLSPAILTAWRAAGEPRSSRDTRPTVAPDAAGRTACAQAYRVLRAILNTAVKDGVLITNPCQIDSAGVVHHRERSTASPAEVTALSTRVPDDLRAAVIIAAWSGLRYGEQFALARRHVDLEAGTLLVERALVCVPGQPITFGRTKTTRSNRTVYLPRFVVDALRAHLARHTDSSPDALVFNRRGEPVTNARLSFVFRRARAAIGREDLTWHDLRHTGATLAYRAGASVPEVQARLGHSTLRAATIYAHSADDSDRILAERLDHLFADSLSRVEG